MVHRCCETTTVESDGAMTASSEEAFAAIAPLSSSKQNDTATPRLMAASCPCWKRLSDRLSLRQSCASAEIVYDENGRSSICYM
jgi:hypothetical protein